MIAAEGEQKASRALREASEVIADSSSALQLRYLQVLYLLQYQKTFDIFDIPNRGSISTGNIADLVVWDSDPLEVTAFAEKVYISGKLMSTQTRSKLLKDRYLNID